MKGLLLVNMGGPRSLAEMKMFLWKMFTDRHILPFPKIFRYSLAAIITQARYKKSWAKYELIGGTPLIASTEAIAAQVAERLAATHRVKVAYSYHNPFVAEKLKEFAAEGFTEVDVLSLYPHYSITTLQSVKDDAEDAARRLGLQVRVALPYFANPSFVDFWVQNIKQHLAEKNYKNPLLIFSGHSIPNTFLDKGDCYPFEIAESARLIAQALNVPHKVSYQSQIGKKWLGPVTEEVLAELAATSTKQEVVLIPISFVNENLETRYDIDQIMIPAAKLLGLTAISKVPIPECDLNLVAALVDTVQRNHFYNCGHSCSLCGKPFADSANSDKVQVYTCGRVPTIGRNM